MPSLGVRLAEKRVKSGKTKSAIAKELGVSIVAIRAWEAGTRPKDHYLARIAEYLGEDVLELQREVSGG